MSEFTVILDKANCIGTPSQLRDTHTPHTVFLTNDHAVRLVKNGLSLSADLTKRHNGKIYIEENHDHQNRSFVISFGWCYRLGCNADQLEEKDMIELLRSHRSKPTPDADTLSGIYCILSYDHLSETLWICTDMWAQYGFYYGSNNSKVVVSSKASIVADALDTNIDGISYLCLLRDTGIPPGRTLYCNVWRGTCGRGLHLDLKNGTARLVQVQPLYRPTENISFKETVDQLIDVLSRVCPSAAKGPSTVVDLTGGNDSRLMAAALSFSHGGNIGKQVIFRVVGDESHPDVIVARKIASTLGWTLERSNRATDSEYSAKSLLEASILSDGNHLPIAVHNRLMQESTLWYACDGLVGSLGGELFRDFFWRHELSKMGRTSRVNFDALLKYRLYASNDVDVRSISDGQLTLNDHNSFLLHPYQMIASNAPDVKNVYKLDIIYLHKLMSRSYCWILSDLRKLILPFLSHEITRVSLKTPWNFRVHRKLVTATVEKMNPVLSAIYTDKGAPMRPLRFSTLGSYVRHTVNDIWLVYQRHFTRKKPSQKQVGSPIPSEWLALFEQSGVSRNGNTIRHNLRGTEAIGNISLSATQCREIQALLLIQSLTRHYKGISPSLSFDGKDAHFSETVYPI
ncbi:MAG: hypothetical protein OEY77_09340 [Nitrospira sp.]|nr:hypothetical protein [Nitrospira sp.]